ncbi:threonine dehydrogenase-like Zn-dependent dehydrogenase [Moryella indoligenes]|uniref:Threonine dehydrogenase-like Zn-dependent dehydrogenase n=1 Tax=Moryella indoligenes TaxID=371674 RepID=A0AAE3VA55_9FIRM|nr:zinc-binding alcohol dehydrogenase family protein [Moryella indoligenes]MDQ0152135.1 threonine dehydrogenase-like Zn-dependent dehydrogenase [Moryella indoligenes]
MKAIKLEKPWEVSCVELPMPKPGEGEALIRIHAAGICGSDIGAFRGTNGLVSYPRIIGHELAGEIVSIPEHNARGLKPGDRVVIDPYLYCGHCYPCSIGRTNCCTELHVLGVHVDGGMAEYYCHPADMLIPIPEGMSWTEAAMAEPLTISLHGIHRGGLKAGEYCAVIGAGPIGLAAALVAQAYGAHAILLDLVQERLDFAKELGIEYTINSADCDPTEEIRRITGGVMAQQVMECSGANPAIRAALDYVSHAGRITLTGWPKQETAIPTDMITKKEIDIRGARTSAGEFEEALKLIHEKRVDMTRLLTKTVSLAEAPETIIDIEKHPGNYMKVVVLTD